MKSMKSFLGVLAALVLVAGGVYGVQSIYAGDQCCAAKAASAQASADKGEAKVEAANATAASSTTTASAVCDSKATTANATTANAGCCAAKTAEVNAEHAKAGAQCTYNAKTASVQCTGDKEGVMTAEVCMAKLSHCGIDVRKVDAQVLAAKLAGGHCGSYTQEQWATMIKSAQALDAKQADAIFATATSEKPCVGDACPMKKVALEMAAAQNEEKKESTN